MNNSGKLICTPEIFEGAATAAAAEAGLELAKILSGCKLASYTHARWTIWQRLAAQNYSYNSIGKVSGFDHSSVLHACRRKLEPQIGRPQKAAKLTEADIRKAWMAQAAITMVPGGAA